MLYKYCHGDAGSSFLPMIAKSRIFLGSLTSLKLLKLRSPSLPAPGPCCSVPAAEAWLIFQAWHSASNRLQAAMILQGR